MTPLLLALLAAAPPDEPADYAAEALKAAAGRELVLVHTDLFPGILLRVKGGKLSLFRGLPGVGLEGPRRLAFQSGGRLQVLDRPPDGRAETAAKLDEAWALAWFAGGRGWDRCRFMKDYRAGQFFKESVPAFDVPFLVVFQRRPASLAISPDGLDVAGGSGDVVVMPLYGSGKPAPWAGPPPEDAVRRARLWASISRRFPIYCREEYQVDPEKDAVRTRQTFTYLDIDDDWKTPPRRVAPISPVAALALQSGFPMKASAALADPGMPTHWGPYLYADNSDTSGYEISGVLKYIDEVEVPDVSKMDRSADGFADAEKLLFRFPKKVDDNVLRDLRERIEGGYTFAQGVAVIAAWMRSMPWHPKEEQEGMKEALRRLDPIRSRFFDPRRYSLVPVKAGRRTLQVRVARPGEQTCSQDLVKETSCFPYYMWEYGYYSGDWETIKGGWEFVKSTFGLTTMLGWANPAPLYTAEHAKAGGAKLGPIGLARLGRKFGDEAAYDLGAHLLAKALLNEWAWNAAAVPWIRKNQPWFQPLEEEMIVHELHGFCGLELMAGSQENTYNEIPLVLDRFNLEWAPMRAYNDFYVRTMAKHFPRRIVSPWHRTPAGSLDEVLKMTPRRMLGDLGPGNFSLKLSHVHPDFYIFPLKIMEATAPKKIEVLTKSRRDLVNTWRPGLDGMTPGMDWRQLAVPVIVEKGRDPYLGWYLMLPPRPDKKLFRDDVLPLGGIAVEGLKGEPRQEDPNWNLRVVSW